VLRWGLRTIVHPSSTTGTRPMGIGVSQLSNANALDVDAKAKAALKELSKSFPPGLEYAIAFDSTTVVGDSIREVLVTLAEAIAIVIGVIFLFLLDWRATIIPGCHHTGFVDWHLCVHQSSSDSPSIRSPSSASPWLQDWSSTTPS
jgi:hypothetical protein